MAFAIEMFTKMNTKFTTSVWLVTAKKQKRKSDHKVIK